MRAPMARPSPRWLVASFAVAGLVALQDPWIAAQWSPHVAPGYLEWFGVITPERAAQLGMLSQDELVQEGAAATLYASPLDIAGLFASSLWDGLRDVFTAGWAFPFRQVLTSEAGRVAVRVVLLAAIATALLRRRAGERADVFSILPLSLAVLVGAWGQQAFHHFAEGLSEGRDYSFVLLRDYSHTAPGHVALPMVAILLVAGLHSLSGWKRDPAPLERNGVVAALALAIAALPVWLHGTTQTVDPQHGFWAPVDAGDLEDLRTIEDHVGRGEGVLVPAAAWGIGEERWIIPQGATAGLLPFSNLRLVFNARLGSSVFYNWRDVAAFCAGGDDDRRRFLEGQDVRWLLLKDPRAGGDEFHRRFRMCELSLERLGVVLPPVAIAGEVALYRIAPPNSSR